MGAIKGKKLEPITCPLCDAFSSKRVTTFEEHLTSEHGTTGQDVWDSLNGGRPSCACGCGGEVRWNGWTKGYSRVVNGHNGNIYAVHSEEEAARIAETRAAALRGRSSWAAGLSKESDERIAARAAATSAGRKAAFARGELKVWNSGLTRETDSRVAAAGDALRDAYARHEITPWAAGLSKDTDERIAKMSTKVSLSLQQASIRKRLDDLKRLSHEEVQKRIETSGDLEVIDGLDNYINDASKVIVVRCKMCGDTFQGSLRVLCKGRCFKCAPGGSAAQEEVARFIETLGVEVRRNDRRTISMELDMHIPDKRVAIEYNGLYWHSHINKSPQYHNNKSQLARAGGISLFHVFEDEWREKRSIVESMIKAKLGLTSDSVGARKCELVELSPAERKLFFDAAHLDGDVKAEIAWGLMHDGEIVYGLSLRRPFHKKYVGGLEVARCCPAKNKNVPGGLSRLVSEARRHCASTGVDKMITYVDTRLGGSGMGYEISGFKRTGVTVPRWWWTDMEQRYNRFKYKADPVTNRSEAAVAEDAGVVKIWGCENIVYEMCVSQ